MKYKMIFDYHTHTIFSHGKGTIEDNIKAAIEKGIKSIAITDHGPGHLTYGIKRSAVSVMREEINRLQKLYPQIEILLGVEANIVENENCLDITKDEAKEYDFINAGYHYGVTKGYCISNWLFEHGIFKTEKRRQKLIERNTKMTVAAIKKNKIKILTHPGDKAPVDMDMVAKACSEEGVLMEISTHHSHLTVEEIKTAAKYDVSFIISSDAHNPERVGDFEGGIQRAIEAGLDLSRIVNIEVLK